MNKKLPKAKQTGYTNYEEWFTCLPFDKQMYVAQHVKKKLDKIHSDTTEILDSCYIGAMIETFEINLDDCIKIATKANENMQITQKYLDSEGETYYMKVNNEEERSRIRLEAKEMLKNHPKESTIAISREIEKEYKLPIKDLHIIVAEARKELKAEKEVAADAEKLVNFNDVMIKESDLNVAREIASKEPSFKIKSIVLEGKNGETYIKDDNGVKTDDEVYKDTTDVEHAIKVLESNTKTAEDNYNKQIAELTNKLEEMHNKKKKGLEKYEEIKAIFAM